MSGKLLVDIAYEAFRKIRNRPKAVARRARKAAKRPGRPVDETAESFNVPTDEVSMSPFPQGTQTLTGIAVLVLTPWLAKYGLEGQAEAIVAAGGTLIGAAVAVFGYLRRKKLPAE